MKHEKAGAGPSLTESSEVPVELDVDVSPSSESHFFVDLSGDASTAGIFVATWRDIPVGTRVTIKANLPDGSVSAGGRVCWVRDPRCETGPGIGVALERMKKGDRARVKRYLGERPPYFYEVDAA